MTTFKLSIKEIALAIIFYQFVLGLKKTLSCSIWFKDRQDLNV